MKNIVKSSNHFFGYFNTLETHSNLFLLYITDKFSNVLIIKFETFRESLSENWMQVNKQIDPIVLLLNKIDCLTT